MKVVNDWTFKPGPSSPLSEVTIMTTIIAAHLLFYGVTSTIIVASLMSFMGRSLIMFRPHNSSPYSLRQYIQCLSETHTLKRTYNLGSLARLIDAK